MKQAMLRFSAVAILAGVAPLGAQQAVFDGGSPSTIAINTGSNISYLRLANGFSLVSPASVSSVRFWGSLSSAFSGSIDWQFFTDNSGIPGTVLASGSATPLITATGLNNASGSSISQFAFSSGLVNLNSGIFWLALHDGSSTSDNTNRGLSWSTATGGQTRPYSMFTFQNPSDPNQTWSSCNSDCFPNAFELSGPTTAPEPSSIVLLASGMVGFIPIARRKRLL